MGWNDEGRWPTNDEDTCPSCHHRWPTKMGDGSRRRFNTSTNMGLYIGKTGPRNNPHPRHPRQIDMGKRWYACAVCGHVGRAV